MDKKRNHVIVSTTNEARYLYYASDYCKVYVLLLSGQSRESTHNTWECLFSVLGSNISAYK